MEIAASALWVIKALLAFPLPFLLAGMMKGVMAMRDEKDESMGPLPYCFVMALLLAALVALSL